MLTIRSILETSFEQWPSRETPKQGLKNSPEEPVFYIGNAREAPQ
jgi:hypothetical protein